MSDHNVEETDMRKSQHQASSPREPGSARIERRPGDWRDAIERLFVRPHPAYRYVEVDPRAGRGR